MEVRAPQFEDIEELAILFNLYRIFYGQSSNLQAARDFINDRYQNRDSQILVATNHNRLVGFAQLYPSFSSVAMQRIYILNDLFVIEAERHKGIARSLMIAAEASARAAGALRIILSTQVSNITARALYESLNYRKNEEFYYYTLSIHS